MQTITRLAHREAARAVAAHKLGRRFESVDLEAGFVAAREPGTDGRSTERHRIAEDEDTILTVGALVVGDVPPSDGAVSARAERLLRRHDFMPMVDEVAAALESRGHLTFGHVDDLVHSVRRRLDTSAMETYPVGVSAATA